MLRLLLLTMLSMATLTGGLSSQDGPATLRGYLSVGYQCGQKLGRDLELTVSSPDQHPVRLDIPIRLLTSLGRIDERAGTYVILQGRYTDSAASTFRVERWGDDPHRSVNRRSQQMAFQATSKKFVTLLVKFADYSNVEPHPKSWYEAGLRNSSPLLSHFFAQVTYGLWNLDGGVVVGWLQLPRPKDYYLSTGDNSGLDIDTLMTDASALAESQVEFRAFDGVNLVLNSYAGSSTGSGGRQTFTLDGETRVWSYTTYNPAEGTSNFTELLSHELGHSFGLPHNSGPYGQTYDSRWDRMSMGLNWNNQDPDYGPAPVEFSAHSRDLLGVMSNSRVYNALPGTSRTIRLERLSNPTSNGYLMARVFKGTGANYYTLESRMQTQPYDAPGDAGTGMPGECVLIHDVDEFRYVINSSYGTVEFRPAWVVDPDNDGDPNDFGSNMPNDAQWKVGETFTDSANGITIRVDSAGSTFFNVTITVAASTPWPHLVRNTNDSGAGSLRHAIFFKDHFPSVVAAPISFRLPTSDPNYAGGVWTIKPLTSIELNGNGVNVDATTQTAFGGNTNPAGPEVQIDGSLIGSFANAFRVTSAGNTIRGFAIGNFQGPNIWLNGVGATGNKIVGCYIGVNAQGTQARPSAQNGVSISDGASGNTIGGTASADRNVVSGNANNGIGISQSSQNNVVINNYVGVRPGGTGAIPNQWAGVVIFGGARNNRIGGITTAERNVISGNGDGISMFATSGNFVMGNYVGTNATGTAAVQNQGNGIGLYDGSTGNVIGGSLSGAGNVCSGNKYDGISLSGSSTQSNTIQGNVVGLSGSGTGPIPNQGNGIGCWSGAKNNTIGGTSTTAGNTISGNAFSGISITDAGTTNNLVYGNEIGLNLPGTTAVGNDQGVYIGGGASNNKVGGPSAGQGNAIVGSTNCAVFVADLGTNNNRVEGNKLGVMPDGTIGANAIFGVWVVDGPDRTVVQRNQVAGGYEGVRVQARSGKPFPRGTAVRANDIWAHEGLGINLYNNDNVTPNDPGDLDTGPNELQNFPVLTSGAHVQGGIRVLGTLNSRPNRAYAIDFFTSPGANTAGFFEGRRYLGSINVTTNANGNAGFTSTVPPKTGHWITATATDTTTNDTSEFSQSISIANALAEVSVNPSTVNGGYTVTGLVSLATSEGVNTTVSLVSGSQSVAQVPSEVVISAGQVSASFNVSTSGVGQDVSVTIAATAMGITRTCSLTVRSVTALSSLGLDPTTVRGGNSSIGTIWLTAPAPPGGIAVLLADSSSYASVPGAATVPAGQSSRAFIVSTTSVAATVNATITARLGAVTKTSTLLIVP